MVITKGATDKWDGREKKEADQGQIVSRVKLMVEWYMLGGRSCCDVEIAEYEGRGGLFLEGWPRWSWVVVASGS